MKANVLSPTFHEHAAANANVEDTHVPATLTIRIRRDQRIALKKAAGNKSLGPYVRSQLFDDDGSLRASKRTKALSDPELLAQALMLLGQTKVSNNLNQLAKAANYGALDLSPQVYEDLSQACAHVAEIRTLLIKALGLKGAK